MHYILYNTLSGNKKGLESARLLVGNLAPENTTLIDVCSITNYADFWKNVDIENDTVILSGGDGTLNRFINANKEFTLPQNLFYYPSGSGNDFKNDVAKDSKELIPLHKYIDDLPTVTINGKTSYFINGIGYGLDGYCCEVGDQLKSQGKLPNYTSIAIQGLLFHFKPVNATVVVDGEKYDFKKVWIAPTMFGRYYGGGMMPTPEQDRNAAEKTVSLMVFHDTGKLQTLMIFPAIFQGEHVKHAENITILKGKNITVTFDRPASLQIDGETRLNVTTYTVTM